LEQQTAGSEDELKIRAAYPQRRRVASGLGTAAAAVSTPSQRGAWKRFSEELEVEGLVIRGTFHGTFRPGVGVDRTCVFVRDWSAFALARSLLESIQFRLLPCLGRANNGEDGGGVRADLANLLDDESEPMAHPNQTRMIGHAIHRGSHVVE